MDEEMHQIVSKFKQGHKFTRKEMEEVPVSMLLAICQRYQIPHSTIRHDPPKDMDIKRLVSQMYAYFEQRGKP